jgi:hypothetical protein
VVRGRDGLRRQAGQVRLVPLVELQLWAIENAE